MQTALLAGCGGSPQASDQFLNASNTTSEKTQSAGEAAAAKLPVRMSRSFLENGPLTGSVVLQASDGSQITRREGAVAWEVLPPTAPPPTGNYLAAFTDTWGCASYDQAQPAQLCFYLQGDVSSFTASDTQAQAKGLAELAQQAAPSQAPECANKTARFVSATKQDGKFLTVNYSIEAAQGSGCADKPIQAALTLSKI